MESVALQSKAKREERKRGQESNTEGTRPVEEEEEEEAPVIQRRAPRSGRRGG